MSGFKIVSEEELRPVLTKLAGIQWPIRFEEMTRLLGELGWVFEGRMVGRTRFDISLPHFSLGDLAGELSRIEFAISDMVSDDDQDGLQAVQVAYRQASQMVSSCLGFGVTGEMWASQGVVWDLPGGGRINLPNLEIVLEAQVWSKRLADVDRTLVRQGIRPGHDDGPW